MGMSDAWIQVACLGHGGQPLLCFVTTFFPPTIMFTPYCFPFNILA